MFTRLLRPFRTSPGRRLGTVGVALVLIAAPLGLLPAPASAALPSNPFNALDGSPDTTPAVTDRANHDPLDNSYTQGAKENDLCPVVDVGSIPPSKADLEHVYVATAKGDNGHTFLYLGWSRTDTNGTVTLDFELNKSTTRCANGLNPVRSDGDVLVTYDFQGGEIDALQYRLWANGAWGAVHELRDSDFAEGSINTQTLKFGEMVIDLEGSGIFTPGECKNLASELVKSRSSDSFQAEMKDFVAPAGIEITNCGSLVVSKTVVGATGSFDFTVDCGTVDLNGATEGDDLSFSLAGGESWTIDDLPPGTTCTVTEADPGAGWTTAWKLGNGSSQSGRVATGIEIALGTKTVAFTNTRLKGDLVIIKHADAPGTFLFDIDCSDDNFDQKGVAASPDHPYRLPGIPTGTTCTVSEQDNSEFSSVSDPADGKVTIEVEDNVVAFTNTRLTGTLKVTKAADEAGEFLFDITCSDDAYDREGVAASPGHPYTLPDIPTETTCTVEERDHPWFTSVVVPGDGEVTIGTGENIVAFTNTAKPNGIGVDKTVNGADTSQEAPLTVEAGSPLAYKVVITNEGQVPLTGVDLADSLNPDLAEACDPALVELMLEPDESITCEYTTTAENPGGDSIIHNAVTVEGTDVFGRSTGPVDDETFVHVLSPAIRIDKFGPGSAHVGDAVVYALLVTNPGNTPLADVTVTDPKCDTAPVRSGADGDDLLSPGEEWTYICTHVVTAGDGVSILNTATAEGTDPLGETVQSTANHTAAVLHPAISIVKTATPDSIAEAGSVTYTYVVTNTGDTPLFDVLVTDDILGAIGRAGRLDPGEAATFARTVDVDALSPPRNIGTAVGTDQLGQTVSASDDAVITVVLGAVLEQPELPRTGAPLGAQTRAAFTLIEVGIVLSLAGRQRRRRLG